MCTTDVTEGMMLFKEASSKAEPLTHSTWFRTASGLMLKWLIQCCEPSAPMLACCGLQGRAAASSETGSLPPSREQRKLDISQSLPGKRFEHSIGCRKSYKITQEARTANYESSLCRHEIEMQIYIQDAEYKAKQADPSRSIIGTVEHSLSSPVLLVLLAILPISWRSERVGTGQSD